MIAVQILMAFTLPTLTDCFPKQEITYAFFFLTVCACQLTEGGHFVLLPTVYAKLFGVEGGLRVYSIGFSFVGIASLINSQLLHMFLDGTWGDVMGY